MNKSIRAVAVVIGIMFLALMANATISYLVRTDSLLNDSRNVRVRDEQFGAPRGPILVGNTPVAENVATGQRPFAYQRKYLNGPLYAPITGYYSYIYGRSGLENQYNMELVGQADSQFMGRLLDMLTGKPVQGGQVQTTISPRLQQAAWDALAGREGGVFALDYTTGAVLAWVTTPSYDPAQLSGLDFNAVEKSWKDYLADPSGPLTDRAAGEIYPPGSTFKMIVASAALENGYNPDTMIDTPARLPLPNSTRELPNESACGNDKRSLDQAFTLSCNTSFANIGMALGADKVREQAEKFGFDTEFAKDFHVATARFPAKVDKAELAMSSIGQFEVAASPFQMAVVAGTIANGGVRMEPYLVSEVRDSNQKITSSHQPKVLNTALSPATAATMQELMKHVVERGTGTAARVAGLTIGGKTGTAETTPDVESYSWFAGFNTDHHIALAVFLQHPGRDTAARTAGQIFGALK